MKASSPAPYVAGRYVAAIVVTAVASVALGVEIVVKVPQYLQTTLIAALATCTGPVLAALLIKLVTLPWERKANENGEKLEHIEELANGNLRAERMRADKAEARADAAEAELAALKAKKPTARRKPATTARKPRRG